MSREMTADPAGGRGKWWLAGAGILVAGGIGAYFLWPASEPAPAPTPVVRHEPALPRTVLGILEKATRDDLTDLRTAAIAFGSVRIDDGVSYDFEPGSKVVYLVLKAQENVLDIMEQSEDLAAKFFPRAFGVGPEVRAVYIDLVGPVPDRYGHKHDAAWITFIMGRRTFGKIEWSGFKAHDLCQFLNQERTYDGEAETFCGMKHDL